MTLHISKEGKEGEEGKGREVRLGERDEEGKGERNRKKKMHYNKIRSK